MEKYCSNEDPDVLPQGFHSLPLCVRKATCSSPKSPSTLREIPLTIQRPSPIPRVYLAIKKNGNPRRRQNPTAMVASMKLSTSKAGFFRKLVVARLVKANILVMPERARLMRERVRAYAHPLSGYPKNRCKLSVINPRDITAIGIHNGRCPVAVK